MPNNNDDDEDDENVVVDENAIIVADDIPPPLPTTSPPRSPAVCTPTTPQKMSAFDNNNSPESPNSSRVSTPRRTGSRIATSPVSLSENTINYESKAWMPAYITTVEEKPLHKSTSKPLNGSGKMKGEVNTAAMVAIHQDECDGGGAVGDAVDTVSHLSRVSSIIGGKFPRQCSLRKQKAICNVL